MREHDPFIIKMNIAHYRAMLGLTLENAKRSVIERLLVEALRDLALTATAARPA